MSISRRVAAWVILLPLMASTETQIAAAGSSSGRCWSLQSNTGPAPRVASAATYDTCRSVVVLFGGDTSTGRSDETWEWDGTLWVQRIVLGPPARVAHRLAFDESRCRVVLFGGVDSNGQYLNDTWEWDGSDWTQQFPSNLPDTRAGHAMTYDADRGLIVMFGGWNGGKHDDTWEYDGTTWTQRLTAIQPSGRDKHNMAYDFERHVVVLFGGKLNAIDTGGDLNDTWIWDGVAGTWTQELPATSPGVRGDHSMVFDQSMGHVLLFGGRGSTLYGDTWEWTGNNWVLIMTPVAPSARTKAAIAYDSDRNRTVLFGGSTAIPDEGLTNETWEYGHDCACSNDADSDGIPDCDDECSDSVLVDLIVINSCQTGVDNQLLDGGCTMMDAIAQCQSGATNHGQFVRCVGALARDWRQYGLITSQERASIIRCVARSNFGNIPVDPKALRVDSTGMDDRKE